MSNFTYLKTNWPDLYKTASEAEQNVNSAPRTSCFYTRRSREIAVKWLYANDSYLRNRIAIDGVFGDEGASRIVHLLEEIGQRAAA